MLNKVAIFAIIESSIIHDIATARVIGGQESSGVRVNGVSQFLQCFIANLTLTPHDGFGERESAQRGFVLFNDEAVLRGPLSGVRVKFLQKARRKFTLTPVSCVC